MTNALDTTALVLCSPRTWRPNSMQFVRPLVALPNRKRPHLCTLLVENVGTGEVKKLACMTPQGEFPPDTLLRLTVGGPESPLALVGKLSLERVWSS